MSAGDAARKPVRTTDALERWAANLTAAIDRAIDDPHSVAFRRDPDVLLQIDPAGVSGHFVYRRTGVAFDLQITADASVGFVGIRCPLVAGVGAEDGRGLASMEIAVARRDERSADTYRYGLQPFNGRVTIDRRHFREALKQLVRAAGFFVE